MTRVGICEDDESVRRVLTDALQMNDYVIIIDIGLPDADGRDVCQALRAEGQHVPVLFLTALDGVHDRVAGFHAGGDDYVVKPFAISEILVRLEALLKRNRPSSCQARSHRFAGRTADCPRHRVCVAVRQSRHSLRSRMVWSTTLVSAVAMTAMIGTVLLVLSALSNSRVATGLNDRLAAVSATLVLDKSGNLNELRAAANVIDDSSWVFNTAGKQIAGPKAGEHVQSAVDSLSGVTAPKTIQRLERVYRAAPVKTDTSAKAIAVVVADLQIRDSVTIEIGDDGPGVVMDDVDDVFRAGAHGSGSKGAGLGLALSLRVARTIGGDIQLSSVVDPTRFTVTVPSY